MAFPAQKLMIPGPVELEADVLEALGGPVVPHYGPEWTKLYNETTSMLGQIFQTKGDVFILVGSGSAAVDACIGSALATGSKIIVGINGFFGERLALIAKSYGLSVIPVEAEFGQPLPEAAFADALRRHPSAGAVVAVHLETSTTVVNPVPEIGQIVRQAGIPYIVDAVSSLGGLPFNMDEWGIDFCAAASQKCFGAPPGVAPVAVGPRGWEAVDSIPAQTHGWYLGLSTWRHYAAEWAGWHPFPVTMATNIVAALNVSLKNLLATGLEERQAYYRDLALYLRANLRRIGFEPFTTDEEMAPVLTAAYGPPGVDTRQIVSFVAENYGIKISPGFGEQLQDKIIRVGHLTPAVTKEDVDRLITALAAFEA